MKLFLFLVLSFLSINATFAVESLCKSTAGDFLSFKVTSLIFPFKNKNLHKEFREKLMVEYRKVCNGSVDAAHIPMAMNTQCNLLVDRAIPDTNEKKEYSSACDYAFKVAVAFLEGAKSSDKCEDKNAISNLGREGKQVIDAIQNNYGAIRNNESSLSTGALEK